MNKSLNKFLRHKTKKLYILLFPFSSNMKEEVFPIPEELKTWGEPSLSLQQPLSYVPTQPSPDIIDWFLSLPSVPLSLRQEFLAFWEMLPLGNYDKTDIERLRLKFRGLLLDILMTIPDEEWNTILNFEAQAEGEKEIKMDLNSLFSMLEIVFYIQLTRGKSGFTAKLMAGHPLKEEEIKPKKFTLF